MSRNLQDNFLQLTVFEILKSQGFNSIFSRLSIKSMKELLAARPIYWPQPLD